MFYISMLNSLKMKSLLIVAFISTALFTSAFRSITNDKPKRVIEESKVVLGMALLNSTPGIDFKSIINELKQKYKLTITDQKVDDQKGVAVISTGKAQL